AGGARGKGGVRLAGRRDLGQRLLAGRVERREVFARPRLDELAADVEAVAVLQRDDVSRLGGGRVIPAGRNRRAVLTPFEVSHLDRPRRAVTSVGTSSRQAVTNSSSRPGLTVHTPCVQTLAISRS